MRRQSSRFVHDFKDSKVGIIIVIGWIFGTGITSIGVVNHAYSQFQTIQAAKTQEHNLVNKIDDIKSSLDRIRHQLERIDDKIERIRK